jgi:hypothetical protein
LLNRILSFLNRYVNKGETSKYFEVRNIGFSPVPELIWGDVVSAGDGAILHVGGIFDGEASQFLEDILPVYLASS